MKAIITAAFFITACATSSATPSSFNHSAVSDSLSGKASMVSFEAANRTGSRRVGGSARSGKGGRYVGGRK